ncbi:hypothetical protein [Klebsiella pneumoniae]|uniref:hypothetical protein n=1 Tax=Klebsiella pneumoniae TaxID=573 RepID=UPI0013FD506F|nr:hypothetical protein [Klebsiella pneumoniae]
MNPTDFIRKHITAALTAEGFAPSVVQGGGSEGTGALPLHVSVNPKGKLLCGLPFSSPAMGSGADNNSRTESGKEQAGKSKWGSSRPVLTSSADFEMTSGVIS